MSPSDGEASSPARGGRIGRESAKRADLGNGTDEAERNQRRSKWLGRGRQ